LERGCGLSQHSAKLNTILLTSHIYCTFKQFSQPDWGISQP
jgi:hypothetical protein